jgi:mono/diheme cytochrome c family protein
MTRNPTPLLGLLALLATAAPAPATTCYTTTPYATASYASPGYSYAYPVTTFLGVPIPILYGSVYTGPASTAAYAPAASISPVSPVQGTGSGDLAEAVKLLRGVSTRLDGVNSRLDALEGRIRALEHRAAPPKPAPPSAAPADVKRTDVLAAYRTSCAACHQRGNEGAGGKFVLLEADGSRAALTAGQAARLAEHLADGSMPPPRNKVGIAPLDDRTQAAMLLDASNFPRSR